PPPPPPPRARGVVQFRIGPPVDRVPELETQLRRQSGLRRCVVATSKPRALYGTTSRLGYVAARYLETQLAATRILGVASSRSLSSVVDSLAAAHRPDLTVVDLLGCPQGNRPGGKAGEGGRFVDGSGPNTAQLISARWGAAFQALPAPFVYRSATALAAALDSERVREALALGQRCEAALVGIGSMRRFDGTGVYSPVPAQDLAQLERLGAVGHLCGRFLRVDGSQVEPGAAPFVLGIGADELRRVPHRIAVAAGPHKVAPIAAAISGGMVTELVTDHTTAAALLSLLQRG
ncbi:sugar-binding transcriptional regulator, partial [Arthrobacter sp. R4]|uniref:sugar-binding transcriptional regulator n=1 Tax=Arthrobacter sp. R4 TaxID=644417 RepID=UPI003EDA01B5